MSLELTPPEFGLILAAVKQYKTRRLKGGDAKVMRQITDRLIAKLDAERFKYGGPDDKVEAMVLGPELDAFVESIGNLELPGYD